MMKENKKTEFQFKKEAKRPANKATKRLGAVVLSTLAVLGANKALETDLVEQRVVSLQPGDGGIDTVCETIADIAEANNFDAEEVNCVYPGQQAHKSLAEHSPTGIPQPGDQILVSVSKNKIGQYTAEAYSPKDVIVKANE